jgi:hypothetical protein
LRILSAGAGDDLIDRPIGEQGLRTADQSYPSEYGPLLRHRISMPGDGDNLASALIAGPSARMLTGGSLRGPVTPG